MKRLFYITVTALFLSVAQSKSISQPGFNPQAQRRAEAIKNEVRKAFRENKVQALLRDNEKCINLQMQYLNAEEKRVVSETLAILDLLFAKLKQCENRLCVDFETQQEIAQLLLKFMNCLSNVDFCVQRSNQLAMLKISTELAELGLKCSFLAQIIIPMPGELLSAFLF